MKNEGTPTNCTRCGAVVPSMLASAQWLSEQPAALKRMADDRPRGEWLDAWRARMLTRAIRYATNEIAGVCRKCTEAEIEREQVRVLSAEHRKAVH